MNISEIDFSHDYSMTSVWPVKDSLQAHEVVAMVIYIVVFVVGVPGNALVLWVTSQEARRSVNAIWFLNLALADLLSCLALPIIISTIVHGNWLFGNMACLFLISLFDFNLYASILFLTTISADRFLLVFQPIWYQKYRVARLAWLASGVAWILALVLTTPYILFGRISEDSRSQKIFCGMALVIVSEDVERAFTIALFVLSFLVPLVTMSICYTFLLLRAWRRPATRSTKTLKVVVTVVTSFFILWLPFQLSHILSVLIPIVFLDLDLFSSLTVVWMALAYANCCINPIIYVAAARGLHIRVFKFQPGQLRQLLTKD